MARIRSIKPEFSDDEKLGSVSHSARLLFIMSWCHSDDFGVIKGNARWLQAQIFPYDKLKPGQFEKWLDELLQIDVIRPFRVNDENFFYIKNFRKHQVINKPSRQLRNPEPPESILMDDYRSTPGVLPEDYAEEGKGREGKGKGKEGIVRGGEETSPAAGPPKGKLTDEDFFKTLKANPAYKGVDIDRELARMDAWFLTPKGQGRQKTRRFIINWLNKIDVAVAGDGFNAKDQHRQRAEEDARKRGLALKAARDKLSAESGLPRDKIPLSALEAEVRRLQTLEDTS